MATEPVELLSNSNCTLHGTLALSADVDIIAKLNAIIVKEIILCLNFRIISLLGLLTLSQDQWIIQKYLSALQMIHLFY